jgi:hypothetical protein
VRASFERVQLDHKPGWTGRDLHPMENMPDYGSQIATHNAEGALRLMLNDPIADKAPALVAYIQGGIDLYHMAVLGEQWTASGGHTFGRKLPIAFAGHLLGDSDMQQLVRDADDALFAESGSLYDSPQANGGEGQVLYGQADPLLRRGSLLEPAAASVGHGFGLEDNPGSLRDDRWGLVRRLHLRLLLHGSAFQGHCHRGAPRSWAPCAME